MLMPKPLCSIVFLISFPLPVEAKSLHKNHCFLFTRPQTPGNAPMLSFFIIIFKNNFNKLLTLRIARRHLKAQEISTPCLDSQYVGHVLGSRRSETVDSYLLNLNLKTHSTNIFYSKFVIYCFLLFFSIF